MPKILLHQWDMSPFCNKTRRCLAFKGLNYEVKDYNGLLARKAAALSPVGKLPVLDYDGERIQDSGRIAEFLERKHPAKPLFPQDPQQLAAARSDAKRLHEKIDGAKARLEGLLARLPG